MQFICDAPDGKVWFRIETEAEAEAEAALMEHAVDKHFRRHESAAREAYRAPKGAARFEEAIGLKAYIARTMPIFLTLRGGDGAGLATAMLPPGGREHAQIRPVIVGPRNGDPYPGQGAAIDSLARHFNIALPRERCFPYG